MLLFAYFLVIALFVFQKLRFSVASRLACPGSLACTIVLLYKICRRFWLRAGILADEMGLGKTLQSISILAYMRDFRQVIKLFCFHPALKV